MELSTEGRQRLSEIAARHGFGAEAAQVMLAALVAGNGTQAQFSHPDLGGMGQWSMGGMIMIGDMFNNGLKARVDGLAQDLSTLVGDISRYVVAPPPGQIGFGAAPWPADLGQPGTSGSQNGIQYAVFPATRRLAILSSDGLAIYDTGDHIISGVSQQQGGTSTLSFTSQLGSVPLESLKRVDTASPAPTTAAASEPVVQPKPEAPPAAQEDIFAKIEQLHGLFTRGVLTQVEFETKKADLLSRI